MKIILLNPGIDAGHQVVAALRQKGIIPLLPIDTTEAWQMLQLHGTSVDLAIIHREGPGGQGDPGIQVLSKIKADSVQSDLPVIMTTDRWSDTESAEHQKTPSGANAYLKAPFTADQLISMIDEVVGAPGSGLVLEDVSSVFSGRSGPEISDVSIHLEAPEPQGAEAAAPEVPAAPNETELAPAQPGGTLDAMLDAPAQPENEVVALETAPVESASVSALMVDMTGTSASSAPEMPTASSLNLSKMTSISDLEVEVEVSDKEIAKDMPYLFGGMGSGSAGAPGSKEGALPGFGQPVGDAVVPGGAAQSPDLETLKKYLLLREQDVAALSAQLKGAKERVTAVEDSLQVEQARNAELSHIVKEHERKSEGFDKEKALVIDGLQNEINDLKFQIKAKTDKVRLFEARVREAAEETERLKERVRTDIRKIRVREKELENRLEIMKKDSEALIGARENKIIELKRKLDLLEFNMDLLQEQYARERENAVLLRERLVKAAQAVRLAGGLLVDGQGAAADADCVDNDYIEPQKKAAS